jgi:hypothetical protein
MSFAENMKIVLLLTKNNLQIFSSNITEPI